MKVLFFSDLDKFLFDPDARFAPIRQEMIDRGYDPEVLDAAVVRADKEGFSFERWLRIIGASSQLIRELLPVFEDVYMDNMDCLLPGVGTALPQMAEPARMELLTYGYPPFQRKKWAGLSGVHEHFADAHFVYQDRSKGDVILERITEVHAKGGVHAFGDDSPEWLLDVREKSPFTKLARVMWPQFVCEPHPLDHVAWIVLHDAQKLARWVYSLSRFELERVHRGAQYDQLVHFYNRRGEELLRSGPLPKLEGRELDRLFNTSKIFTLVDRETSAIVAAAQLTIGQTLRKGEGGVEYVLVDPDFRGRGLSRMLMVALHNAAYGTGLRKLKLVSELERPGARALYQSMGYKLVDGSQIHFERKL